MITSWKKDHGATGVTGDRGRGKEGGTETGAQEMPPAGADTIRALIKISNPN